MGRVDAATGKGEGLGKEMGESDVQKRLGRQDQGEGDGKKRMGEGVRRGDGEKERGEGEKRVGREKGREGEEDSEAEKVTTGE